jgi:hypothetical protein
MQRWRRLRSRSIFLIKGSAKTTKKLSKALTFEGLASEYARHLDSSALQSYSVFKFTLSACPCPISLQHPTSPGEIP